MRSVDPIAKTPCVQKDFLSYSTIDIDISNDTLTN